MQRHVFDPVSLVTGVLFTGLGVAWLAGNVSFAREDAPWVWALGVIALGVALLVGSRPGKRSLATSDVSTAEEAKSEDADGDEVPGPPES